MFPHDINQIQNEYSCKNLQLNAHIFQNEQDGKQSPNRKMADACIACALAFRRPPLQRGAC